MSTLEQVAKWVRENKLRAIGTVWGSGVVVSAAYQWTRPIPTQLKVIHTRMYAQALTLVALGMAGAVDYYEHRKAHHDEMEAYQLKLKEIEQKVHAQGGGAPR
jgi:hypothetical protein